MGASPAMTGARTRWLATLAVLLSVASLAAGSAHRQHLGAAETEDFAFEPSAAELDETPTPAAAPQLLADATPTPVLRLWGVPDAGAEVGRLFHLRVPQDAFSGGVDHYEAKGQGSGPLPAWLLFDKATGLFEGIPSAKDVGENYVTVRAIGRHTQDWAKDVFSIEVAPAKSHQEAAASTTASAAVPLHDLSHRVKCAPGEEATVVKIVLDVKYEQLKPRQRVAAVKNLAGFLALHPSVFQIGADSADDGVLRGAARVLAGPGDARRRSSRVASAIQWQAGCAGRLVPPHATLVAQLAAQARDGTIAEVVGRPVVGWHVETGTPASQRERREAGSGDYGDGDEEEYDYEEEEESTEAIPVTRIVPTMVSPTFGEPTTSEHPHRHHHGDSEVSPSEPTSVIYTLPSSPLLYGTIISTPVMTPERPTRLPDSEMPLEPSRAYTDFAPAATPVLVTEVEPSATFQPTSPEPTPTEPLPTGGQPAPTDQEEDEDEDEGEVTTMPPPPAQSSTEASTAASTSEEPVTTPPTPSTPPTTSEEIFIDVKNIQPIVEHRLPKQPITAGKALRYRIPENSFSDLEDGNTRNLRLLFKTSDGKPVPRTSWVQFNPVSQEIYALPLEEHVSKWTYQLEASDKEGSSVSDSLELLVQHHKGRRTVNFEFSLHLRIENPNFPSPVDWQMLVLDGLARLYGDVDNSQITVLNVTTTDPVVFSWTNDSLPRSNCPKSEIGDLHTVLVNEAGEPSPELVEILSPQITVRKVSYLGLGQCEKSTKSDVRVPSPPISRPSDNYPPALRNQVDHINATVGELLVFVVPEDSFYDPEDGNTRNLKLSLLTMDRGAIPATHWLQFDVKNQEFYGIPMASDVGRKEYQLVCQDSAGHTSNDGLVVVVHPAVKLRYNVEFTMTLDKPYDEFHQNAFVKRKFIDKLRELFGDRNASAIALSGVIEGSTIVTWHNRSLPTEYCPHDEVGRLRQILIKEDESISDRVRQVLGPEFPVLNIRMTPTGACQGEFTVVHTPDAPPPPVDDARPASASDEYLVTFVVPAVIIAAMLLLAGIVACVLYRRRRTGKMSVGDEDERQSFRNKGIPVIFQDELEEKPDPENKSPVIMKEEKPPLPPPEYRRDELERCTPPPTAAHPLLGGDPAEDTPYQPPPPFAASRDNGRQNRPKPTPTYRKPPPYVPP